MRLYIPSIARRQLVLGVARVAALALAAAAIGGVVAAAPSLATDPGKTGVSSPKV